MELLCHQRHGREADAPEDRHGDHRRRSDGRQFGRSADHYGAYRSHVRRRRPDSGGLRSGLGSARRHNRRHLSDALQDPIGVINGEDIISGCVSEENPEALYAVNYPFIGGAVADGYIYFVPTPNYVEQGATFRYLYTLSTTTPYSILTDMLLVDPAKDMGGIPELAAERIAELRRMAAELRQPRNCVERPEFSVSAGRGSVKPCRPTVRKDLPASAPRSESRKGRAGRIQRCACGRDLFKGRNSGSGKRPLPKSRSSNIGSGEAGRPASAGLSLFSKPETTCRTQKSA